ncbi:MAG: hypothetical protein LBR19_02655 [Bifidobacteriaceae bacterium]|jgi:antitoxin (DNA-binding transcriptional repressor) of toxin-antitoxin stability system|nr:hypothetical protein [Bifidobacteriaceae bacterium]
MNRTVGIRELNQRTSAIVRDVKAGTTLILTDHGEPWGLLTPYPQGGAFERLVAEGAVERAIAGSFVAPTPIRLPAGRTAAELLEDERGQW